MNYLFYILFLPIPLLLILCVCGFKILCTNDEKNFKKTIRGQPGNYSLELEDDDIPWSIQNVIDETETSMTSAHGPATLQLLSEVSNQLSIYPLTRTKRLNKSDSAFETMGNENPYERPVDIIIRIEDVDEICIQMDLPEILDVSGKSKKLWGVEAFKIWETHTQQKKEIFSNVPLIRFVGGGGGYFYLQCEYF